MMKNKKSASALISDLKRKTRKAYNSEDKIRIIIEGMRGETTIAELLYTSSFLYSTLSPIFSRFKTPSLRQLFSV
jgi:hypothetical protein